MPTWGGILQELQLAVTSGDPIAFDTVRRKYLAALHQKTGRNAILYATKWTDSDPSVPPSAISIVDEDLQGLMEVVHGLAGSELDLILHSPGGSLEAAEAMVAYLRSKFDDIRVVVPSLAMSAATMVACAADKLLLGKHSFLGPTDPQFVLSTPLGQRMVPAQSIIAQFDQAVVECADPKKLPAYLPMLGQYGPDLLVQCEEASRMSEELVCQWLEKYMFRGESDAHEKAGAVAGWLSDHGSFWSHARHIPRQELEDRGLRVEHLEDDSELQDLVLSVFHATTHTFSGTNAVKIVENHLGKAFVKMHAQVPIPMPGSPPGGPPMTAPVVTGSRAPKKPGAAAPKKRKKK